MQTVKQLLTSVPDEDVPDGQLLAMHEYPWEVCRCGKSLRSRLLGDLAAQGTVEDAGTSSHELLSTAPHVFVLV